MTTVVRYATQVGRLFCLEALQATSKGEADTHHPAPPKPSRQRTAMGSLSDARPHVAKKPRFPIEKVIEMTLSC